MATTHGTSKKKQLAIFRFLLERGTGVIPDLDGGEDWLTYKSTSLVLGVSENTVKNNVYKFKVPRHPIHTAHIRLSDYLRCTREETKKR